MNSKNILLKIIMRIQHDAISLSFLIRKIIMTTFIDKSNKLNNNSKNTVNLLFK